MDTLLTREETVEKVKRYVCKKYSLTEIGFRMHWFFLSDEQKVALFNEALS